MADKQLKVIIDCDPGCDDTVALIAALTSPEFDVLGLTSIGGNVGPEITQKNALGICALVNRTDVPVYAGCQQPLAKTVLAKADDVHGKSGVMGLVLPFDRAGKARDDMDAADFILKASREHADDPVTLVVIGPMTNVALAYRRDSSVVNRIKQIVTMGGAYGSPGGNITEHAEFNIFCDPLAAKIVYDNFGHITALPLDVTHETLQDEALRAWLSSLGAQGKNVANMLAAYAEMYPGMARQKVSPLHDFHTVAALLQPDLYSCRVGQVSVETTGDREGQTILNPAPHPSAKVMMHVRRDGFFALLRSCLKEGIGHTL